MKPIIHRRYLTILEVMISMVLSMILISIVVYFYQQLSLINMAMDKTRNEHFQRRFVEFRLNAVLPQAVSPTNKDFHFFLTQDTKSLIFTFDNCVKLNRNLTDLVIGQLFLDDDHNLTLAIWPIPKRWKDNEPPAMSKEVLMENVENLSFEFYTAPDKGHLKFATKENNVTTKPLSHPAFPEDLKNNFTGEWRKEYRQLPAIVKVVIKRKTNGKEEEIIFAYPLPNSQQPIIYTQ